jgi:hypothetical protein
MQNSQAHSAAFRPEANCAPSGLRASASCLRASERMRHPPLTGFGTRTARLRLRWSRDGYGLLFCDFFIGKRILGSASMKIQSIRGVLRNFVEKRKTLRIRVDKLGESVKVRRFVGCHSAGQGGRPLFDNRYDVPESVRPQLVEPRLRK